MSNDTAHTLLNSVVSDIGVRETARLLTRICRENAKRFGGQTQTGAFCRRAWLQDAGTVEGSVAKLVN